MNSSLRSLFIVAGALAVAVLSGCQTAPKVQTEFDKSATFASAKTFAIRPIPQQIPGVDPGLILRVGPAATAAVRSSLTAKGYTANDVCMSFAYNDWQNRGGTWLADKPGTIRMSQSATVHWRPLMRKACLFGWQQPKPASTV